MTIFKGIMFLLCLLGCSALLVNAQGPQYDRDGRPYNAQNSVYDQNVPYGQGSQLPQNPINNPQDPQYNQGVPYNQGDQGPQYNQGNSPQYNQGNQGSFYNQGSQYPPSNTQGGYRNDGLSNDVFYDLKCPEHWVRLYQSCYRFIRSPLRPYEEARRICQVLRSLSCSKRI